MPKEKSLICAFLLDGQGNGREIGWQEITTWKPQDGILWVHLDYTLPHSKKWLHKITDISKFTINALLADETRPHYENEKDGFFISLRSINLNPGEDPEDMVSIRMWVDPHRIITTRKRRIISIDEIKKAIALGHGPKSSIEFILMLNDKLSENIQALLDQLEDQVDQLEETILTKESRLIRPVIAETRRQAILIRRYLAPQREALSHLQADPNNFLNRTQRLQIRELLDRITRYIEDLDATRDRATVLHEELSSRLSEQVDKRMYILSMAAVVFLPLTFLTGLLGMNVGGVPGANFKWGFIAVCGILLATGLATLLIFKRKKWM